MYLSIFRMSVVRKMISMKEEDVEFLQSNSISLSKFMRNNIRKLKETGSTLKDEPVSNQARSTYDYK